MKLGAYIRGDRVIWMVILVLAIISMLAVFSSSQSLAFSSDARGTVYFLIKQLLILAMGGFVIVITHLVPYRYYSKLAHILLFIVIPLLAITLAAGRDINSARRWLDVPGTGLTIQPSDFAKIILIMYIARVLSQKQAVLGKFREAFLPIIIAVSGVCILILPSNFSTAAILFGVSLVLMFIGRIPVKFLSLLIVVMVGSFMLFLQIQKFTGVEGRKGTWKARIENFRNADHESMNSYQVNRAKVAIVNGGIIGKGPGNSIQKEKLPQANSDFIYAIIVEEYGLVGGIVVVALYLWLLFRTALIVRKSNRTFAAFVSIGLCLLIVFQALVNMAVAVNLVPVTGQPLPYISSGGSSVLFTSIALGVILSVSWGVEQDISKKEGGEDG